MKCSLCGKEIKNLYYINGKIYGYNCYKQQLALLFKQWEDEKNYEYSVKCFSAMKIFENKKSSSFHDSIIKQWSDCKKLTSKQLDCIVKGFTLSERIDFESIWSTLTRDDCLKRSISSWIESNLHKNQKFIDYIENESVNNAILYRYKKGFHYVKDVEDGNDMIFIMDNGRSDKNLNESLNDEYLEVLKIIDRKS